MARKTVRVPIPIDKPDAFSKLCKNILEKNAELGNSSPLKTFPKFNQVDFNGKLIEGDANRTQSEKLREQAEAKMEQARIYYGTAKGQSVNTPNTLYNYVDVIKNYLLSYYSGAEEKLSEFGFHVVIGSAKSPTKKAK